MKHDNLTQTVSGSKAHKILQRKHPECPECGADGFLYISGVEQQEYKCSGDEHHEFPVETEELLTEKELDKLRFHNLEETRSLEEVEEFFIEKFGVKSEYVTDPEGKKWLVNRKEKAVKIGETDLRDVQVHEWLCIENDQRQRVEIEDVLTAIFLNPHLDYFKTEDEIEIVKIPAKRMKESVLKEISETESLGELQRLVQNHFDLEAEYIKDPFGDSQWVRHDNKAVPVKTWLQINTEGIPELTQAIEQNPNLDYHIEDVMKVVQRQRAGGE